VPDETVTRGLTIMTTTPNAEVSELHDRMPVILDEQHWPTLLGGADSDSCGVGSTARSYRGMMF
jgi:putative SOS response-associated peptidase YedK